MPEPATVALILGLSYVGKDVATDFLKRILGPLADASGKALAHPIEEWHRMRVQRANELVAEAASMLEQVGVLAKPVPGRVLWPILERGSMEEHDGLRLRWAALLANAADARGRIEVSQAFVRILADLSPQEVGLLDHQWARYVAEAVRNGWARDASVWFSEGPEDNTDYSIIQTHLVSLGLIGEELEYNIDTRDVGEQVARLVRDRWSVGIKSVRTHVARCYMTGLGIQFMLACQPPGPDCFDVDSVEPSTTT